MRSRLQPHPDAAARTASRPAAHDRAGPRREADAGPAAHEAAGLALSNQALSQAWSRSLPEARDEGQPLDPALRADMEARFGESFADVRVHDDAHAHRSAAALQASAYTVGPHVVFSRDRFAPQATPGRRLLAHELAHVVQQRRGGAAPVLSPQAPHEAAAEQAASQVAAGQASVQVAGGTGVGVARERETDAQRLSEGAPDAAPICEAPAPYPLEDPLTRGAEPGPRYWLTHEPDVAAMRPHRLDDEANQIDEWFARQTTSSRDDARLLEVRNRLRAEALAREQRAARPAPRRKKGKQTPAQPATDAGGADTRPRFLREQRSIGSADPGALATEYDELLTYAQDENIPKEERELAQIELANLRPAMRDELARRSNQRHAEAIGQALAPDAAWDVRSHLSGAAKRIDSIRALPGHPGHSYLMRGSEMLVMSDEQVAAVRDSMIKTMARQTSGTHHDTEQVQQEWHEFVERTFEEQKYVGFFTMLWSGENPSEWDVLLMPHVIESNQRIGRFKALRAQAQDPWRTSPAPLLPMAEAVGIAEHHAGVARTVLDYRIGKMMTAAGEIVGGLDRVRMAGQFAAAIAFSPAGGALYGGVSSTAVQLSEMAHGQRDSLDPLAIGFDAAAGYAGAKVTRGVMGFGGKAAPLWQRGALFVLGDRAGASASVGTRMALDKVSGRKDYSAGDIAGAVTDQATDAKQMLLNMALAKAGRFVQSRSKPAPKPPAARKPAPEPAPTAQPAAAAPPVPSAPIGVRAANDNVPVAANGMGALIPLRPRAGKNAPVVKPQSQQELQAQAAPVPLALAVGQTHGVQQAAPAASAAPPGATLMAGAGGGKGPVGPTPTTARPAPTILSGLPDPKVRMGVREPPGPAKDAGAATPTPKPAPVAANDNDPLVATRVQSDRSRKSTWVEEGSPDFAGAARSSKFVVQPRSQAEASGFRAAGTAPNVPMRPITRNGVQVESAGAARDTPHNITARVTPKKTEARGEAAFNKTVGADVNQMHAYKALLQAGEYGVLRPGNVSTGGVDAITVSIVGGKVKVFLNDFTGMKVGKTAKDTHQKWATELDAAAHPDRMKFGDPAIEAAVAKAVASGEVYVRTIRVDASPEGARRVLVYEGVKLERGKP